MTIFLKLIENIYFGMISSCIAIIGVSASNILHFAIEDYYQSDIIPSYFLGIEYATSQSVLIVASLLFILILCFENRLKRSVDLYKPIHRKFFLFLTSIMILSILIYIVLVVYGYFAGKSDVGGLQRILVTLFFLSFGICSAYFRFSESENFLITYSKFIEGSFVIILCIITVSITLHFAAPNSLMNYEKDIKKTQKIEFLSKIIEQYNKRNKELPENLNQLSAAGYFNKEYITLSDYKYELKKNNQFEICTTFLTNKNDFIRRQKKHKNGLRFEKGDFCFQYQVGKENTNMIFSYKISIP